MSSDLKADGVESPATRSQPPPERLPFPVEPATASAWAEVLRVLRVEAEAAPERDDRASLLQAVAELEESMLGDQPAAARSYLAAYNARAALRPPLDALVRLYRRRSSFANLGKLLDALDGLKAAGNSLFVVEHELDVIRRADWIVDVGPGAHTVTTC